MTREDIIRMAREAGLDPDLWNYTDAFERYAYLVAAAERNKLATWMIAKGYATGHGDTIEDLLVELEWQVREKERQACAKLVEADGLARGSEGLVLIKAAGRIRARGEK